MDSNLDHGDQHYHNQPPQQQQQMNSGLTRYKSAPSSYFATLLNTVSFGGEDFDEVLNPLRVSSPETDRIFQRFVSSGGSADQISSAQNPLQQSLCQMRGNEPAQQQFLGSMKHEQEDFHSQNHHQHQQQQQMLYQGQCQEGHNSVVVSTSAMDNSFLATNSVAMDRLPPMRMSRDGGGGNSNLIRQSSSPAGFFSQINIENGFPVMRGVENYGTSSGGTRAESSFPTAKRLKNQMNFSSGPTSSSGLLARIPEIAGKSMGASNLEDATFDETQPKDENYMDGFASGSWDDSSILSENFLKGLGESDRSSTYHDMDLSENQSNEGRSRPPTTLTHHLSLPTSSTELSSMFQDSVPLRIRAKRGCATHPRSIAERVRRTKISERMRKLQELVPNMDKQTNTSDMLDLAVDYIKDLQKQVKTLADQRAKCTCSSKQKP